MKKNKFVLPILLSASCLASSIPFVTSCSESIPPQGNKALTILANADSKLTLTVKDENAHVVKPNLVNLKYSFDGTNWTKLEFDKTVDIKAGETLRLIGYNNKSWSEATDCHHFNLDLKGDVALGGEILAIVDNGNATIKKLPNNFTFSSLFEDDDAITSIEPTLIQPVEPGRNQWGGLFSKMFYGCDGLTEIPSGLFNNFEFAESVECNQMFASCTNLHDLPEGLFSTVKKFSDMCFSNMFEGCSSLESIPELFPTNIELSDHCFMRMFSNCTGLEQVDQNLLPWSKLTMNCYSGMFEKCTSLTTAPLLPATQLDEQCYAGMFSRCTSLTKMPDLPATTLARGCYVGMFEDCCNLTSDESHPIELKATSLAENCYWSMFDCSWKGQKGKVTYIKIYFKSWPEGDTTDWLANQADLGTIVSEYHLSKTPPSDDSHVPVGWTFVNP